MVFSAGDVDAALMLIGEQPGDVEDREGIPFVGPAGRLLQRAVEDAGLAPDELYVTNAVKHFRFALRGKRRIHQTPQVSHLLACQPWLAAEIRNVRPELIVVLGATAARSVLGAGFRVTKSRGTVLEAETLVGPARVLATMHPSAVLRLRGEEHDRAYADLVADLHTAGEAVRRTS
jgi:DNA polymerase